MCVMTVRVCWPTFHGSVILPYILTMNIFSYFFQIMSGCDQTFDPNILIGHCDLISLFSDFALYLGTQLDHEQTSFTLCLRMTRPLTLK